MSFIGRYPKGDVIGIAFVAKDNNGVPALPDTVPSFTVLSDAGAIVKTGSVPVQDRYQVTAFFFLPLLLDQAFAAGHYHLLCIWRIAGVNYVSEQEFEVTSIGDPVGAALALAVMEMPAADYAVMMGSGGRVKKLRNPRSV